MVPLLPCRSIDEIVEFYGMLGFTQTYYQVRPYPCVGLKRDDIQMQFFGLPDFKAEDSYGSCLVIVPDTGELYRKLGRQHARGLWQAPRFRHPPDDPAPQAQEHQRPLRLQHNRTPGGNWIRFFAATVARDEQDSAPGKLGAILQNAIVMGDSKGDHVRAAESWTAPLTERRHRVGDRPGRSPGVPRRAAFEPTTPPPPRPPSLEPTG